MFLLQLSFFGWFCCPPDLGLLLLYVKPYYQAALTEFYRYLKETQGQQDWQPQQKPDVPEQAAPASRKRKVNYDPEQFEMNRSLIWKGVGILFAVVGLYL